MALLAIYLQGCKCCAAAEEQVWHRAITTSTGVIVRLTRCPRQANLPLVSNSKTMPLAMKCQINNQKSRASPTQQTWIPLGLGISSNMIGVVGSGPIAFQKHSEKTTLRL